MKNKGGFVMPTSLIPSFLIYCYTNCITPGPANFCSLGAALRYGRREALLQWRGLFVGFTVVAMTSVVACWLLGTALQEYVGMLSWVGAAYMLWMAWHMLRASGGGVEKDPTRPSFRNGVLVQLTNVKIMIYCMTALGAYVLPYTGSFWDLFLVGLFLPLTGPIMNLVWLFAGASLQKLFANHRRQVDVAMAAALALCALSLVWPR